MGSLWAHTDASYRVFVLHQTSFQAVFFPFFPLACLLHIAN